MNCIPGSSNASYTGPAEAESHPWHVGLLRCGVCQRFADLRDGNLSDGSHYRCETGSRRTICEAVARLLDSSIRQITLRGRYQVCGQSCPGERQWGIFTGWITATNRGSSRAQQYSERRGPALSAGLEDDRHHRSDLAMRWRERLHDRPANRSPARGTPSWARFDQQGWCLPLEPRSRFTLKQAECILTKNTTRPRKRFLQA